MSLADVRRSLQVPSKFQKNHLRKLNESFDSLNNMNYIKNALDADIGDAYGGSNNSPNDKRVRSS